MADQPFSDEEEYADMCRKSYKTGDFSWMSGLPFDSRFPNHNQTSHCIQNFADHVICKRFYGEDFPPCNFFEYAYKTICAPHMYEKWEEMVQNGTFFMPIFKAARRPKKQQ